jgi:hypothetical protein
MVSLAQLQTCRPALATISETFMRKCSVQCNITYCDHLWKMVATMKRDQFYDDNVQLAFYKINIIHVVVSILVSVYGRKHRLDCATCSTFTPYLQQAKP